MYLGSAKNIVDGCSRKRIFAYLDGELSANEELDLEVHFAGCKECNDEVNAQKKVSNSLEIILEEGVKNIELPENFTKVVTAKAESRVSGLRKREELSRALFICAVLLFLVTLGLGTRVKSVWFAFEKFTDQFAAIGGFVFHLIYDAGVGITVILRSLNHKLVFNSALSLVLVVAILVVAFFSLSRLILRHNRQ